MTDRARAASCSISRPCTRMPDSSKISRRTASSMVSAISTKPARHEYMPGRNCFCRPSRHLSPEVTSMITTGSVRGKCSALQFGQSRFQPPCFHRAARAAIGAKAVALMPAHQRFRHRDRGQLLRRQHALHRHAAQFGSTATSLRVSSFSTAAARCPCRRSARRRATPGRSCRDWRRISAPRRSSAARADRSLSFFTTSESR